jgi:hypothetical protein
VTLNNGIVVKLDVAYKGDRLGRALAPIVPATPGFVCLRYYDFNDGEEPFYERLPIVAWRVAQRKTYPVVPNDEYVCPITREAVLLSDGRVVEMAGDIFDNEEAWRSAIRERSSSWDREVEAAKSRAFLSEEEPTGG